MPRDRDDHRALTSDSHVVTVRADQEVGQDRPRPSSLTHRSRPANDRFLPGADSPVADPTVLGKWTFCSYWAHSHAGLVFFKQQHVARAYPERPANGNWHGNPAFRSNLRPFLQVP